jgi:hypothetical protein
MMPRINRRVYWAVASAAALAMAAGCNSAKTPAATTPATTPNAASGSTTVASEPQPVDGCVAQNVPPPQQVASSANAVEVIKSLPPKPPHVTHRHKTLHLVKYQDHYYLQDADEHLYNAARDNQGHYYPACTDSTTQAVYPLYYDPDRDDYYRASSDQEGHYFRCYEDEPSYVYYYDDDPVYVRHHGYNPDCEPVVYAPRHDDSLAIAIPLLAAAFFLFRPEHHVDWHHDWNRYPGYNTSVNFIQINESRPQFNYYVIPPGHPYVYANQYYAQRPRIAEDPHWYPHARFTQAALATINARQPYGAPVRMAQGGGGFHGGSFRPQAGAAPNGQFGLHPANAVIPPRNNGSFGNPNAGKPGFIGTPGTRPNGQFHPGMPSSNMARREPPTQPRITNPIQGRNAMHSGFSPAARNNMAPQNHQAMRPAMNAPARTFTAPQHHQMPPAHMATMPRQPQIRHENRPAFQPQRQPQTFHTPTRPAQQPVRTPSFRPQHPTTPRVQQFRPSQQPVRRPSSQPQQPSFRRPSFNSNQGNSSRPSFGSQQSNNRPSFSSRPSSPPRQSFTPRVNPPSRPSFQSRPNNVQRQSFNPRPSAPSRPAPSRPPDNHRSNNPPPRDNNNRDRHH